MVSGRSRSVAEQAFDDLDNDGDIDIVILNSRRARRSLGTTRRGSHWLDVRLVTTAANREGIGADRSDGGGPAASCRDSQGPWVPKP